MTVDIDALITIEGEDEILKTGLEVAASMGLDTTTWRTGDPTLSQYKFQARVLSQLELMVAESIKGRFLSKGQGDWLKATALEVYGIEAIEGTASEPTVTLTNTEGGFYDLDAGDLTVKSTTSGKTFRSTDDGGGPLSAGTTRTYRLIADEVGSETTVGVDEIDSLVTSLPGVVIDSSTAAIGVDEESSTSIVERCGDTLGALSPDGPPDAYEYVATNPDLTGTTAVTHAKSIADDDNLNVTLYIAGPSGSVAGGVVTAVQNAIEIWATPLCVKPTTISASGVTIDVTATIDGEDIPPDFEDLITAALEEFFIGLDIGEDVFASQIVGVIHRAVAEIDHVVLSEPSDTVITDAQIAILGDVNITEA